MKILRLDEAIDEIRFLKSEKVVLFAGSGVSIWQPTMLPSGASVTNAVWKSLILDSVTGEEELLLQRLSRDFPFEHLFEICPNQTKAIKFLIGLYNCEKSNPIHEAFAKLIDSGLISHVVTTNYDHCFEAAISSYPNVVYNLVVDENEASVADTANSILFKVHGTAKPDSTSLIYTLKGEGLLPKGKRILLEKLLTDKVTVFIGYSGLDFDLCPLIATFRNIRVLWFGREAEPHTENAKALLKQINGTYVQGDMRDVLTFWMGEPCDANISGNEITSSDIEKVFTAVEIASWRVFLLNALGFPRQALHFVEKDKQILDKQTRLSQSARSLFYEGKYKQAAKAYQSYAWNLLFLRQFKLASDVWLDTSDSYRAGGYFLRAWASLFAGKWISRNYDKAKYYLKKSLLVANVFEGLNAVKAPQILSHLAKHCLRKNLNLCMTFAIKENLHDFQQVGYLASKYDVDLDVSIEYRPKNAEEGYRHLGYYHAEVMNFCDLLLKRNFSSHSFDAAELFKKIEEFTDHCELTGQYSNLWKLLAVKKRFLEQSGFSSFTEIETLWDAVGFCEYSRTMKKLQLGRFGIARTKH